MEEKEEAKRETLFILFCVVKSWALYRYTLSFIQATMESSSEPTSSSDSSVSVKKMEKNEEQEHVIFKHTLDSGEGSDQVTITLTYRKMFDKYGSHLYPLISLEKQIVPTKSKKIETSFKLCLSDITMIERPHSIFGNCNAYIDLCYHADSGIMIFRKASDEEADEEGTEDGEVSANEEDEEECFSLSIAMFAKLQEVAPALKFMMSAIEIRPCPLASYMLIVLTVADFEINKLVIEGKSESTLEKNMQKARGEIERQMMIVEKTLLLDHEQTNKKLDCRSFVKHLANFHTTNRFKATISFILENQLF